MFEVVLSLVSLVFDLLSEFLELGQVLALGGFQDFAYLEEVRLHKLHSHPR